MMALNDLHIPVLLERCIELLEPAISADEAVLVDATLGLGGHTEALLERFPSLTVVGIDRDAHALALARRRLTRFGDRLRPVHAVYDELPHVLDDLGIEQVQGELFDLGVSSMQLDEVERGFSYARDAPLDMRMNQAEGVTAAELIADSDETALRRIFQEWGEEKFSGRYARAIVAARQTAPIERTSQLVDVLQQATPMAARHAGHPAKRVFQALRIAVNRELSALSDAIPAAIDRLALGGRIVVMSYQSLEDRIVKRALQQRASDSTPAGLPTALPESSPQLRLLTRGAELASPEEIARNPRSTPVRLRAAERIRVAS